jgi:ubiquinone/menaquinone biosynthesis C-methylase UbiE
MNVALDSPRPASYNIADQARMAAAVNYFAWQARLVKPELGQRVIEIGCGSGNFTNTLLDRDAVLALDVDPDCIEQIRNRFPDRGNLRSAVCDAADLCSDEIRRFCPDSVACLNVLEHIEDDRDALTGMASVLPPGGVIVLIVPAFESLYGPIDRNLGHHRRYTRKSIAKLAQDCNLEVRKLHYMNCMGVFGWWFNAHVLRRDRQSEQQIAFFDRFVVPIISRMEAAVLPPLGQSLFVVLRKP